MYGTVIVAFMLEIIVLINSKGNLQLISKSASHSRQGNSALLVHVLLSIHVLKGRKEWEGDGKEGKRTPCYRYLEA